MLNKTVIATLQIFAWFFLIAGAISTVGGILVVLLLPESVDTLWQALVYMLAPFFSGAFLWALLLALVSIIESLLVIRDK